MRFKNIALIVFLSLALFGSQSMSHCKHVPAPEPGLRKIRLFVHDDDGTPVAFAKIGLFGSSDFNDDPLLFQGNYGCLIDTFYTDANGQRNISYVTSKYNYLLLAVLPDNCSGSSTNIQKHDVDIDLTSNPAQPLLMIHTKIQSADSIKVVVNSINNILANRCPPNNLSSIPLYLDQKVVQADADFTMKAIPNSANAIQAMRYKDGEIIWDTLFRFGLTDIIQDIQFD